MLARRPSSKETITLCWEMSGEAWDHWAQGRGGKSVRDVILEGIDEIRKNPESVRERCEAQREREADQSPKHRIEIQLPASDWGEACQRVGRIGGEPVRTGQLLKAVILESESWKQSGNAAAEYDAGWHEDSLVVSSSSTTEGLSLGRQERIIAWIVAVAAVVGASAGVATAIAAWCSP